MLDKDLFAKTMVVVAEIYKETLTKDRLKMYYLILGSMTNEEFERAVKVVLETHVWKTMPTPAEFIEAVKVDSDALVIGAWEKVTQTMARVGAYSTVAFDDPLIHGFIQTFEGGWPGLCAKSIDELVWVRKEFERYYKASLPKASKIACRPLIGLSEGDNMVSGHKFECAPIYVGDRAICERLLSDETQGMRLIEDIDMEMEGK